MVVVLLFLILVVLSIMEKTLYKKENKDWDKVRLFIAILMIALLFSIFYLIIDTSIGVFYVFSAMMIHILKGKCCPCYGYWDWRDFNIFLL